jgi:Outer membrane protein beta-barrel domain
MKKKKISIFFVLTIIYFNSFSQEIGDFKILTTDEAKAKQIEEAKIRKAEEEKKRQDEINYKVKRAIEIKEAKMVVSQNSSIGIKVGFNNVGFSKEVYERLAGSFTPFKGTTPKGYIIGLVLYPGKRIPVKLEVNYNTLGGTNTYLSGEPSDFLYRQINGNLLYNLIAKKGIYAEIGAGFDYTFNFRLDDRLEYDEKLTGFSGLIGLGYRINNKVDLNARYRTTLSNNSNNGDEIESMKGVNISIGFLF